MAKKAVFSWSGGKDSMLALHQVLSSGGYDVASLLTTYNSDYGRVFMHGVRVELLRQQAESLRLPLIEVGLGKDHTSGDYEDTMREILLAEKESGVCAVIFGDLFLEDVRADRQGRLAEIGLEAVFPLWKQDTRDVAKRFIASGYKAVVTCVDGNELDEDYVGCEYDERFLKRLPPAVDPCGEYGEFHTFAYDGPLFSRKVAFTVGEKTLRDGRYWFCELEEAP